MDHARPARQLTFVLFIAQSMASAGFIAAATLNSILGEKLSGQAAWAGIPSAVYSVGGALAASLWGILMDRLGRRVGIALGLVCGAGGSGLVLIAVGGHAFILFLFGMALMGIARAAVDLGRFAAAEVHPPAQRGRAISNVVLGGTFGAIFGPLLVEPMGRLIQVIHLDELSGAYAASLILFFIGALVIFLFLRPDPRDLGRAVARLYPESTPQGMARPLVEIFLQPAVIVAVSAMVLGQVVMVAVMVITSVHMRGHQHGLGDISTVISAHTLGMYAFSVISGRLADRWGRERTILAGAVGLCLACLAAPLSPDVLPLAVALFLLGLGWNFCFVGGSTLLADQLSPAERARTQGMNDLFVGLASALASLGSGLVFAGLGYTLVALIGAGLSMIPLVLTAGRLIRLRGA
jgi:MFS family permease